MVGRSMESMPSVEEAEQLAQLLKNSMDRMKAHADAIDLERASMSAIHRDSMAAVRTYVEKKGTEAKAQADAEGRKEAVKEAVARKTKANGKVEKAEEVPAQAA